MAFNGIIHRSLWLFIWYCLSTVACLFIMSSLTIVLSLLHNGLFNNCIVQMGYEPHTPECTNSSAFFPTTVWCDCCTGATIKIYCEDF